MWRAFRIPPWVVALSTSVGVLVLALGMLPPSLAAAPESCASWPGEPEPLPTTRDADLVTRRWAVLRATDLRLAARTAEASDPARARQLWMRVACVDPGSADSVEALDRIAPVRVHRPTLRPVAERSHAVPTNLAGAWSRLGDPIEVVRREASPGVRTAADPVEVLRRPAAAPANELSPAPSAHADAPAEVPDASPPDLPAVSAAAPVARMEEALEALREARFADALRAAERAEELPDGLSPADRAALAVAAGTAALALGDGERAERHFSRALSIDPELVLDPERTSPKVLRAFESARRRRGS